MAKYDPTDRTRPMPDEFPLNHELLIAELCDTLERRALTPMRLDTYLRSVRDFPIDSLKAALRELYNQVPLANRMPSPDELKALVRSHAPKGRPNLDEERWRRRYDVWQRGRFSDEALDIANSLSDEELGIGHESVEDRYLHCQQPGCIGLIPWPSDRTDAGRMFCPNHQPVDTHGKPATRAEKQAILAQLTPEGKAFLRGALPGLMADIPVTEAERIAAKAQETLQRPRAFEETAEGPGVNAHVFLTPLMANDWPSDYVERRHIVRAAGWKYDAEQAVWRKGKRKLSDESIDGFPDTKLLTEFVGR